MTQNRVTVEGVLVQVNFAHFLLQAKEDKVSESRVQLSFNG